jgi:hypothetical protein
MIIITTHDQKTVEIANDLKKLFKESQIITETQVHKKLDQTIKENPNSIILDIHTRITKNGDDLRVSTFIEQEDLWKQLCAYTNGVWVQADEENDIISKYQYKYAAILEFPSYKDNRETIKKIGEYFDE